MRRYTLEDPCPICGGFERAARGRGERCHGYHAGDGSHAYCSREEHGGNPSPKDPSLHRHWLKGPCDCSKDHREAAERIAATPVPKPRPKARDRPVAELVYDYTDRHGEPLFHVVRREFRDGTKSIAQRRPDPTRPGIFSWSLRDVPKPLPLYNSVAIAEVASGGETLLVVEGEKHVDRLGSLGLLATTSAMGAGKAEHSDWSVVRGLDVVLLPDNDAPGHRHMEDVAERCRAAGAGRVRLLELPGLPAKGDVLDWLDAGGTPEELRALIASVPEVEHPASPDPSDPYATLSDADLGLEDAGEVIADEVRWGWPERSEMGELTLWAGPGGQGKTLLCLWIAAKCSTGGTFPDGATAPRGRVLIVSAEDSPSTTLKPRLAALGADMERITFLRPKVTTKTPDGTERVHPQSFQDIPYWQAVLARKPDTVMLFVDPLPSYLGQGVDDHRNGEVRAVLERFIAEVVRPAGIMFQATTHSSKRADAAEAIHKVIGSVAYTNLARNVHLVAGDPDDPGRSFARQDKTNHAPRDVEALEFRIAPVEVELDGKSIKTVTVEEARCVERSSVSYAFDGGGKKRGRKKGGEIRDRVIRWLYRALDDALPDGVQVKDLVAKARDDGLLDIPSAENPKPSISALYKAKDDLSRLYPGQEVREIKDGNRAFWCLSPRTVDEPVDPDDIEAPAF